MILSFFVYFATLGIMYFLLSFKSNGRKILFLDVNVFIAILFYSVIMGMRYGVGMDFFAYLQMYNDALAGNIDEKYLAEPAFYYIIKAIASHKLHYGFFFGILAFIQIYFVALAFNDNKRLLKCVFLAFFACGLLSWMNGLRQITSVAIFIYSIRFIADHKRLQFYLLALLAVMFHKSSVLLFIAYPAFYTSWHKRDWNVLVQLGIYLLSIFISLGTQIDNFIFGRLGALITYLDYDYYADYETEVNATRGLGFAIAATINAITIVNSNKMKIYFKETAFSIYYSLFFIGLIWAGLTFPSQILGRPNYFMFGLNFIVYGHVVYYLWATYRKNQLLYLTVVACLLILLSAVIINGEGNTFRYLFNWMDNLNSYQYINIR